MIKLNIKRFRTYTEEEIKNRKEAYRGGYAMERDEPVYRDGVMEDALDVEITEEQFEAIRKAVLESF